MDQPSHEGEPGHTWQSEERGGDQTLVPFGTQPNFHDGGPETAGALAGVGTTSNPGYPGAPLAHVRSANP